MKTVRTYPFWLTLCFAFISTFSFGATCNWEGPSTITAAAWNLSSNWSCGNVPTVTDDADFPAGATYLISENITTPARIRNYGNMTIATGVNLSAMKIAVFGNVTNNGNISFNGDNKTGYRITVHSPAMLTNTSLGVIDVFDDAKGGIRVSSNASMVNEGTVTVNVPPGKNGIWVEVDGSYSGGGSMNITSGETLCEGECAMLLPVELAEFKVASKGETNLIGWTTASEKNAEYFSVEFKGEFDYEWREVTQVSAFGNSVIENRYSVQHMHPERLSFYRIKMVDWDGSFEYSPVISVVNTDLANTDRVSVFPTIADKVLYMEASDDDMELKELCIFSMHGNLMHKLDLSDWRSGRLEIQVANFPAGAYIIKIDQSKPYRFFVSH